MRGRSERYDELREYCETVPIVDCHDHSGECGPRYADPIEVVRGGYFHSDLWSALSDAENEILADAARPLEQRWVVLEKAWRRTCHTGYAQVTRRVLRRFYGVEELTLDALKSMRDRLVDLSDPETFEGILAEAKIAVRLLDVWPDMRKVLDGTLKLSPRGRLVISLPGYHAVRSFEEIQQCAAPLGRTVTCLDEYLAACRELFEAAKRFGAVAFKDQSAYSRRLDYGHPTRADAEAVFNALLADPRRSAGYPDGVRALDDFLFQAFLRMAREMDLPVQIHTGHMAGIRNEITKTNAAALTGVLELHRDVRFDLFHANWPFAGELMFLAKNYPNVAIDFCWTNIIDPVYCQRLFAQALSCVPHGKVHGYGSDFGGCADRAWAHAAIARDNLAVALSDMIDREYLDLDEAKQVARMWLFDNPNEFYRLGL
jgi:predicted TIM-barrel fold metal-dependent hydrolase